LAPFSLIYCAIASLKKRGCKPKTPSLPTIGVGNLIVGGSGKTPLTLELAKHLPKVAVVLKGYKRKRKGSFIVGKEGRIFCDVKECGDEAFLLAKEVWLVIVANDRMEGIELAKKEGAEVVILDDAFHSCIKKFEIIIDLKPKNPLCLPAGAYRLPRRFLKKADLILKEGKDFKREVTIKNPTPKMVLVTAIANPKRLEPYLPKNISKYYFPDHHFFTFKELEQIWEKERPTSFLVTSKDKVKLEKFGFELSLLELQLNLDSRVIEEIKHYLQGWKDAKKDSAG